MKGIWFHNISPADVNGVGFKILPYDDDVINAMSETELEDYLLDRDNYGSQNYMKDQWALPLVTGHKYKFHIGLTGVNWEFMNI